MLKQTKQKSNKIENKVVKNAIICSICQSPADLINEAYYQCQKNSSHLSDVFVGIFTDMSYSP